MSKKIGQIERKSHKSVGTFFFGLLIGFLLTVGLLTGFGAFVYFKVSPKWLNDKFNAGIDLGNEDMEKLTLSVLIPNLVGIATNSDSVTLASLEKDLGIKIDNQILSGYGITMSIEDLKTVPLNQLSEKLQDKIKNISLEEVEGALDAQDMRILKQNMKYYISGDSLYTDKACTKKSKIVPKEIDLTGEKTVTIKGKAFSITEYYDEEEKISVRYIKAQLKQLPASSALAEFTETLGDNITLGELKDYDVSLPSFIKIDNTNKDKTINQLDQVIDELYIADIMDYSLTADKQKVFKDDNNNGVLDSGEEITGVLATVAKTQVKDLDTLSDIDDWEIAKVLDYDKIGNDYYDNGTKVSGILSKIAPIKVGELATKINLLSIADIMDYKKDETEGFYFIDNNSDDVFTDGVDKKITGIMNKLAPTTVGDLNSLTTKINQMTIADVLDLENRADGYYKNGTKVSSILQAFAGTTVEGLQDRMDGIKLYEVLGYSYDTDGAFYYIEKGDDNVFTAGVDEKIEGIMAALAGKKLDQISTAVEDLTVKDVFTESELNTGVFKLLDQSKGDYDKKINEIAGVIAERVKDATLAELVENGIVETTVDVNKNIKGTTTPLGSLKIYQLIELIPLEDA